MAEAKAAMRKSTPDPGEASASAETASPQGPRDRLPAGGDSTGLAFVLDVPLQLSVEIGSTQMLVREVVQLDRGSVVELDRGVGDPADVLVNGRIVARGEVTMVDDRLAVRLVEIIGGGPSGAVAS